MPETGSNHSVRDSTLSIQADLNGFSFGIFDSKGSCRVLKQYTYTILDYDDLDQEIHKLFRQEELLRLSYKKCYCLFISNKSTLIPSHLFDVQHLRSYLDFVTPLDDLDEIHFRQLPVSEAINVFAIPSPIAAIVHTYQPNTLFLHQSIPLIHLLQEKDLQEGLILHLSANISSIALYAEGRLVLSNTFNVHSFTDTLYYLSNLLQQWNLSLKDTPVFLSGNLTDADKMLFESYYPKLIPLSSKAIGLAFGQAAGKKFHLLQQLSICE
ncbi:MAG: DUF3822 family protein [Bacteroidales bacterium]|nr:DUF3822 family protein [Bacteroidales bacterium]MCL2133659.1 DUF3822 family protein [Bacteroidales bacterium]